MSLAPEQKSPPAIQTPRFSLWRLLRFPLIILIVFGCIVASPWVCLALNVDLEQEWAQFFFMVTQWLAPAVAVVILLLWWMLFSDVRWITRFAGFLVVGAIAAGFIYSQRKGELTIGDVGLIPRFHFFWEPSAEEKHAQFMASSSKKTDNLPSIDASVGPEDFPSYRGPKRDGVITFAKLHRNWDGAAPVVSWRHPCPGGYGGVAVAGNIVVTLEQHESQEVVACYDRATGRPRWAYAYNGAYKDIMGDGPRSTPTIHGKMIFSIGATGELVCLNAEGKLQWSKNVLAEAKAKNVKWGLTGSPLIVDDLVIAHAGIDPDAPADSALIAFEQADGKVRWKTGNRKAGYSSPQLATLAKVPQILLFDGAGLVSYDPKTGKELWTFPWITDFEMNSIQPLVVGDDSVFISSELKNGCALLRLKSADKESWTVETVWQNKNLAARYANPVTDGKHIFGLHNTDGFLRALDVSDGRITARGERQGPGQMLLVDDLLLVVNGKTGDVGLFETADASCKELGRFSAFENRDKTWNTPALAGDQLFIRNQAEIACVKLPRRN